MLMQKLVFVAQSGASAVLYLLLFLSVISIGVVIERWWYFRKRRLNLESAAADLEKQLRAGNVEAARKELGKSKSVEAEIVCDALVWYADGAEAVQEIVQKGVRQRRRVGPRLRRPCIEKRSGASGMTTWTAAIKTARLMAPRLGPISTRTTSETAWVAAEAIMR